MMWIPPETLRVFPPEGGRHPWPGKASSTVALAQAMPVLRAAPPVLCTDEPPLQRLPVQNERQRRPNQRQRGKHPACEQFTAQRHAHQQGHGRVHKRVTPRQR
eukprot:gene4907-6502_t